MNGSTQSTERLLPEHLATLRDASGLLDDVITERGYWSATQFTEVRRLGFTERQCSVPALVVPLWNVDGEAAGYQLRPDTPRVGENGRVVKYETPRKSRAILDVPPRCQQHLGDPSVTLWITEGSKKADALASTGVCAIALSGVWNWRGSNDFGGKLALADWDSVALNERLVRLAFDSDVARKRPVGLALQRLAAFLERKHAVVEIVYLPDAPSGAKQGVDDFLATGSTLAQLEKYVSKKIVVPPVDMEDGLPEIVINNRHLRLISQECWEVIVARNDKDPTLFKQEERLVRVVRGDAKAFLKGFDEDNLRFVMERWARFVSIGPEESGSERRPARMPLDIIKDVLATWNKPIPKLRGVVRTPLFTTEGALSVVHGYQAETEVFYQANGDDVPTVPDRPSGDEVKCALAVIDEWLHDFPFVNAASRANAMAIPLTYVARELVAKTPLFVIDAPTQGTGKGLLAETAGIVMEGEPPAITTEARDGEEWRKRITAQLLEGASVILIDNVKRRLDSGELAAVLTAAEWSDRVLGSTETVRLPNRAVWLTTGNNIQLDGEISRRSVSIRLDAKRDRPWEGRTYLHPDLPEWVREQRGQLVWSFLVLVQNWLALGRPAWDGEPLGSFEAWSRVVGGTLQAAGVNGFLQNSDELYRKADAETEDWRDFVGAWAEVFEDRPVKVSDLAELVLRDDLLPSLTATVRGEPTVQSLKIRLGKALTQRRDRRISDWSIRFLGRDPHQKGNVFALERAESAESAESDCVEPNNSPQGQGSVSDSNAEGAEGAESDSNPYARSTSESDPPPSTCEKDDVGTPLYPPHSPQPPRTDSKGDSNLAESGAEGFQRAGHSPRCDGCGMGMSVVRISNRCAWCRKVG